MQPTCPDEPQGEDGGSHATNGHVNTFLKGGVQNGRGDD